MCSPDMVGRGASLHLSIKPALWDAVMGPSTLWVVINKFYPCEKRTSRVRERLKSRGGINHESI
jgi:hypothetical protein